MGQKALKGYLKCTSNNSCWNFWKSMWPSKCKCCKQSYSPSPATQPSCNCPGQPEPFLATPSAPAFADSISIDPPDPMAAFTLINETRPEFPSVSEVKGCAHPCLATSIQPLGHSLCPSSVSVTLTHNNYFCGFLPVQITWYEVEAAHESKDFITDRYLKGQGRMWEGVTPAEPNLQWSCLCHQTK